MSIEVVWRKECAMCGELIEDDSPQPYCKECWKEFLDEKEKEQ